MVDFFFSRLFLLLPSSPLHCCSVQAIFPSDILIQPHNPESYYSGHSSNLTSSCPSRCPYAQKHHLLQTSRVHHPSRKVSAPPELGLVSPARPSRHKPGHYKSLSKSSKRETLSVLVLTSVGLQNIFSSLSQSSEPVLEVSQNRSLVRDSLQNHRSTFLLLPGETSAPSCSLESPSPHVFPWGGKKKELKKS